MPPTRLNVRLLEVTQNAASLIYAAFKQCYSTESAANIFETGKKTPAEVSRFLNRMTTLSHDSPLEHVKFTFAIEGVSRALTHQLVRYRVASYSQQSQRYVKGTSFNYIIPPLIEKDEVLRAEFIKTMEAIQISYNRLLSRFSEKGITGETANQDARFVLPQATESKIVVTMNCRELRHFFEERCCTRAQWEIRELANQMLEICKRELPIIFANAGPKCIRLGYCPEGKRFSCGRFPLKETVIGGKI